MTPQPPLTRRVHHQPDGGPRLHVVLHQQRALVQRQQAAGPAGKPRGRAAPAGRQAARQPAVQVGAEPPGRRVADKLVLWCDRDGGRLVGPVLPQVDAHAPAGAVVDGADLVAAGGDAQQARLAEAVAVALADDPGLDKGAAAHGGDAAGAGRGEGLVNGASEG
jgi:hypothetical protein